MRIACFVSKVRCFFHRKAIASRGTTCWRVVERKHDDMYILKDSWRSVNHASEITLLRKAMERNLQGIFEVIAFEEVIFDGKLDDIRENIMRGLQFAGWETYESPRFSGCGRIFSRLSLRSSTPYPLLQPLSTGGGLSPVGSTSLSRTRRGGAPQLSKPRVIDWPQHQHRINPGVLPEARCLFNSPTPYAPKNSGIPLAPPHHLPNSTASRLASSCVRAATSPHSPITPSCDGSPV